MRQCHNGSKQDNATTEQTVSGLKNKKNGLKGKVMFINLLANSTYFWTNNEYSSSTDATETTQTSPSAAKSKRSYDN